MPAEIEAKFRADSPSVLEALTAAPSIGFAELGAPTTADELDRYLDTADGRLAAARWACRLRSRAGGVLISLKGPAESTDGAWHHARPELEGPASDSFDPDDWPPSEARSLVLELAGDAPLVERLALRQRRTERAVLVDGRRVGTLSLDTVEVVDAPPDEPPLLAVELELIDDAAIERSRFEALAAALLERGGLRADPQSKLEHALERLAAR